MASPILCRSEKGRKIFGFLKEELGLPSGTTKLSVHLEVGDCIRVDASFLAEHEPILTEADALADLHGHPRPDNPTVK